MKKERTQRHLLSLVLIAALTLTLTLTLGATASAAEVTYAVTGGNLYFDTATGTITDCDTSVSEAKIPAKIGGVAVTSIGESAFWNCSLLESVTIPKGVTSIGKSAFGNCSSLTGVELPDSVVTLGDYAFYQCGALEKVILSDRLTSIGQSAFYSNKELADIAFPKSLQTIGKNAFYGTALTSVTIPATMTIGEYAFQRCLLLESVSVACQTIPKGAFSNCPSLTSLTLDAAVEHIGDHAFDYSQNLTQVLLPPRLETIGEQAFAGSGLTEITIPGSVETVGSSAFGSCKSLTTAVVGAREIGSNGFYLCSALSHVTLTDNVETLGDNAFSRTGLTGIVLSERVKTMGTAVFAYCPALETASIGCEYVTHSAFANCTALTQVTLLSSVRVLDNSAFWRCSALKTVTAGEGLEVIAGDVFEECGALQSVDIPTTVNLIASQAFFGCTSLTSVNYEGTQQQWQKIRIGSDNDPLWNAVGFSQPPVSGIYSYGPIPEFMVTDIHGETVTNSTYGGAKVFLFFRPNYEDDRNFFDKLMESGLPGRYEVTFIAMALGGATGEEVQTFADNYENSADVVFCTGGDRYLWQFYAAAYDGVGYVMRPAAFITTADDTVGVHLSGYLDVDQIEGFLTGESAGGSIPDNYWTEEEQVLRENSKELYENLITVDPEIFLWNESGFQYYHSYGEGMTEQQEAYIRALAMEITAGCATADEKILTVANYLAENIYYDYDYYQGRTSGTNCSAYDVLTNGYTVCAGFAGTYAVVMQMLEIPCVYVSSCFQTPCHAWNMVYNGERWILLDTTWMTANAFVNGEKIKRDVLDMSWFDATFEKINSDPYHIITGLPYMLCDGVLTKFPAYTRAKHFDVPEGVTKIGVKAFRDSTLESITLPKSLKMIEQWAFEGSALRSVTLPEGLQTIGQRAFEGSALRSVEIPGTVSEIGDWAFLDCSSLKEVIVSDGVTTISRGMFKNCTALTQVKLPESVTTIEGRAFRNCVSLAQITLPGSLKKLEWEVFHGCTALKSLRIPDGVTELNFLAAGYCTALTQIVIPTSVTLIRDWVFFECPALKNVYYAGTQGQWEKVGIGGANQALIDAQITYSWSGMLDGETEEPELGDQWGLSGDVNGDGKVNGTDTNLIFRYVSGTLKFIDRQLAAADVNGDGKVNGTDTNLVFRFVSGAIKNFQ